MTTSTITLKSFVAIIGNNPVVGMPSNLKISEIEEFVNGMESVECEIGQKGESLARCYWADGHTDEVTEDGLPVWSAGGCISILAGEEVAPHNLSTHNDKFYNITRPGYVDTVCKDCGEILVSFSEDDWKNDYNECFYFELGRQDAHECYEMNENGVKRHHEIIMEFAKDLPDNRYESISISGRLFDVRRTDLAGVFVKVYSHNTPGCIVEERISNLKKVLDTDSPKETEAWMKRLWSLWRKSVKADEEETPRQLVTRRFKEGMRLALYKISCPPDREERDWKDEIKTIVSGLK